MPRSRVPLFVLFAVAVGVGAGCKFRRPPAATAVWLGPAGGCIQAAAHPRFGSFGCWGVNDVGQLGDGTTTPARVATPMELEQGAVDALALGARHTCAVFGGGAVYCWGDGARGQLGADVTASSSPVAVGEGDAVGVGGAHTCVRSGGQLRCFGADDEGQLGGPGAWERAGGVGPFTLGEAHTCVAYANEPREVVCRGRAGAAPPSPVLASALVASLAAGRDHTCALLEGGEVRCWGKNDCGQLGDGTTKDSLAPVSVLGIEDAVELVAGASHTCARLRNNTVVCWGDNRRHQLAAMATEQSTYPVLVRALTGIRQLAAGGDATCARLRDGAVRCWGRNDRGQLGDGTFDEHTVPMPIRYR